jgi:hypothetical protein
MDAPLAELLIRFGLAVLVTVTATALILGWRHFPHYAAAPLVRYLTATVTVYAAWRWYIVWVGLQSDTDGSYATDVEPYVRAIGNVLLSLVFVAILLMAVFHRRRR